jgi:hypothetical protein
MSALTTALRPLWLVLSTSLSLYVLSAIGVALLVPKKPCATKRRLLRTTSDLKDEAAQWFLVSRTHPQVRAREEAHEAAYRLYWLCVGKPEADVDREIQTVRRFKTEFDRALGLDQWERVFAPMYELQERLRTQDRR